MPTDGTRTRYFCLTGLVVHELRWKETLSELLQFRHSIKRHYKVYLDDELHAADMITKPSRLAESLQRLKKHERLAILRHYADRIATLSDISLINIVVDKEDGVPSKEEVFRRAWYTLFQRFENTIRHQNFPGPKNPDDKGIVFPDKTDGTRLKRYLERMRLSNPFLIRQRSGAHSYKDEPVRLIIEDPVMRDSGESYFVQTADCAVFLLKQHIQPSAYMKKHGGNAYFHRLNPVLCKHASNKNPEGIVWL